MPDDIMAVIDGYAQASGKSRTDIAIEVLGVWADNKIHESILICRVAGVNPLQPETKRK